MSVDISDLTPEQQSLFEAGSRVMLPFERTRLQRALARHLRRGTSKYARSIPTEGIESVALSLSAALWGGWAWLVLLLGLSLTLPTRHVEPIRLVGYGVLAVGVSMFFFGAVRLVLAGRSRNRFRKGRDSA